MSSATNIGRRMRSFNSAPQFDGFSKVVITVSDEVEYSAGTDTGRTLTLSCPWGTQAMAENILSKIKGYQYQPYTATDAILDPAFELGDGITANSVYGGIYSRKIKFGPVLTATISAPSEEEIDHEYPYVSKQERTVTRNLRNLSAQLTVQAGLISAEVTDRKSAVDELHAALSVQAGEISAKVSVSGGNYASFGWNLRGPGEVEEHPNGFFEIVSNGYNQVLFVDEKGLSVQGRIKATGGDIGGFTIESNYLSYNGQVWNGTNTIGAYIGTEGIQFGKNFKVDSSGNLYATSGTFTGSVYAKSIQYGDDYGTLSGAALTSGSVSGGWGGAIASGTISTHNTVSGINTSLGYADFANSVFNGWEKASAGLFQNLKVEGYIELNKRTLGINTVRVMTGPNTYATIQYLG